MNACKFALKTIFIITKLTEGEGKSQWQEKVCFLYRRQRGIKVVGLIMLASIYFVKDYRLDRVKEGFA